MRYKPLQTPAEELAELRARIARLRLRLREASLSALLRNTPAKVQHRPGWPIQRLLPATPQPTRH